MKDTFILKTKYKTIVHKLPDAQAGVLFKLLFDYVEKGTKANITDPLVDMAFDFIQLDLDYYNEAYQKKIDANKENGKKGGNPNFVKGKTNPYYNKKDNSKTTEDNPTLPKITEDNPIDMDIDIDIGTDIDMDTISFLEKKKQKSERADFFSEDKINKVTSPPVNDSTDTKTQLSRRARKMPPSLEEVEAYCQERKNGIEAAEFWDFYTSKGWKVGAQPMKDWQAAVRVWERKRKEQTSTPPTPSSQPSSRTYTPMIAPTSPPPIYFDFEKVNGEMKEYRYYFKNGEKIRLEQ